MTYETYGNQYMKGYRYSFFSDRIVVQYELSYDRSFSPWVVFQLGGDSLLYKGFSVFGRSLTFELFPQY
jgi:hypothetical protein